MNELYTSVTFLYTKTTHSQPSQRTSLRCDDWRNELKRSRVKSSASKGPIDASENCFPRWLNSDKMSSRRSAKSGQSKIRCSGSWNTPHSQLGSVLSLNRVRYEPNLPWPDKNWVKTNSKADKKLIR